MIDRARIHAWRETEGSEMTSAMGEYVPAEFWELLDAYEDIVAVNREHVSRIEQALKVTETGAMMQFDKNSKFAEALRFLIGKQIA